MDEEWLAVDQRTYIYITAVKTWLPFLPMTVAGILSFISGLIPEDKYVSE
jgi:hypothetical protein